MSSSFLNVLFPLRYARKSKTDAWHVCNLCE